MPRRAKMDDVRIGAIGRDRRMAGVDRRRIDHRWSLLARRRENSWAHGFSPRLRPASHQGVIAGILIINPAAETTATLRQRLAGGENRDHAHAGQTEGTEISH